MNQQNKNKKGMPNMKSDMPRVKHQVSEVETEKRYLEEIAAKHFNPDECPINEWIIGIFGIE